MSKLLIKMVKEQIKQGKRKMYSHIRHN